MNPLTREGTIRSRFAAAESLTAEIAQLRARWRLDRHPFLVRWLSGELTELDLQLFAAEHHHAVMALAEVGRQAVVLSDGLLGEQLVRYAADQQDAVELSCRFASAAGWGRSWYFAADPLPQTEACARTWTGEDRSLAEHLVTIHALESAFAQLVPRQLGALLEHYGFPLASVGYFARDALRGARDAAVSAAGLTSLLSIVSPDGLVLRAEMAYRAYFGLLDGVQMLSQRSA